MLRLMGYEIVSGSEPEEWDVLWTHEYSLMNDRYIGAIRRAKPHQIVNHVAGSGYYTSKVSLALSLSSKDTLRAFQLPRQKESLLSFAQNNPHMLWVQKDNTHRNIRIRKLEEMDLNKENSFVQQFVDNPLLIDNRKFDIGVYTVVTSIHPLRVYTYAGDVLLRFCSKNYTPFDVNDVDKYVVGDDYTPIWEIPSLKRHYIDQKLGWKGALDAYLTLKGMDPQKIWKRIDRMIAEVFQSQQAKMLHALKSVPSKARFFELSRFDFMVDVDLNVHLLEANMSPNLSSGHFAQNQILYEEVLLNLFSLVGIASAFTKDARKQIRARNSAQNFLVSDKSMHVMLADCLSSVCSSCDAKMECQLCANCMTPTTSSFLKETFIEHMNRRSMKLLSFDYDTQKPTTREDHLLWLWRKAKCKEDLSWC
ncbi:hypothetical protein Aduo_016078 [Ancylostoma duodenale]